MSERGSFHQKGIFKVRRTQKSIYKKSKISCSESFPGTDSMGAVSGSQQRSRTLSIWYVDISDNIDMMTMTTMSDVVDTRTMSNDVDMICRYIPIFVKWPAGVRWLQKQNKMPKARGGKSWLWKMVRAYLISLFCCQITAVYACSVGPSLRSTIWPCFSRRWCSSG